MSGPLTITALGQASFELRDDDTVVLVDPWFSTKLEEDEGVTRHAGPARRPGDIHEADLVCITHEHADHLDPPTLAALAADVPGAIFLAPAPAVPLVEHAGVRHDRVHPMFDGIELEAAGARVTALRAAHEPHDGGYRFWRNERGDHRALSYLVELGDTAVFFAGDTVWWPGMEEELRALDPDAAILPINGRDAEREARGIWGNMDEREAAQLAAAAGVPLVIPCHFDGVEGNLGDPDAFLAALPDGIRGHVLHPGDALPLPG